MAEARLLRSKVDRDASDLSRQEKSMRQLRKDLAHLEELHRRDLEELQLLRSRASELQIENETLLASSANQKDANSLLFDQQCALRE